MLLWISKTVNFSLFERINFLRYINIPHQNFGRYFMFSFRRILNLLISEYTKGNTNYVVLMLKVFLHYIILNMQHYELKKTTRLSLRRLMAHASCLPSALRIPNSHCSVITLAGNWDFAWWSFWDRHWIYCFCVRCALKIEISCIQKKKIVISRMQLVSLIYCYVLFHIIRIYQKSRLCFQGKCGSSWSDSSWESSSCSNICRLHDILLLLRFVLLLRHMKIGRPLISLLSCCPCLVLNNGLILW